MDTYTLVGEGGRQKELVWIRSDASTVPTGVESSIPADPGETAYLFSF